MPYKISGYLLLLFISILLGSCATNKDIYYFQDANTYGSKAIEYSSNTIQPNDILDIKIGAFVAESAIPYNKQTAGNTVTTSLELLALNGYLVTTSGTIKLPVLGITKVANKTINELELALTKTLEEDGHLIRPSVQVRLVNAKVTVLGEVNSPGTYLFTEQFISVPQALGYAGDLTLKGKRTDLLLIREVAGNRMMTNIDLTSTNWMNDATYYIKPNDVLVVNPNTMRVKSSGIIGSLGSLLSIGSILLSTIILLTK